MKQTAVLFLYEFVQLQLTDEQQAQFEGLFQQAFKMEKEQMKLAYHEDRPFLLGYETGEFFEEHYQENYETKND